MSSSDANRGGSDRRPIHDTNGQRHRQQDGRRRDGQQSTRDRPAAPRVPGAPSAGRMGNAASRAPPGQQSGLQVLSPLRQPSQHQPGSDSSKAASAATCVPGKSWASLLSNKAAPAAAAPPATAAAAAPSQSTQPQNANPDTPGTTPGAASRNALLPAVAVSSPSSMAAMRQSTSTAAATEPTAAATVEVAPGPRPAWVRTQHTVSSPQQTSRAASSAGGTPRGFSFSRGNGVVIHHSVSSDQPSTPVSISGDVDNSIKKVEPIAAELAALTLASPRPDAVPGSAEQSIAPATATTAPPAATPAPAKMSWAEKAKAASAAASVAVVKRPAQLLEPIPQLPQQQSRPPSGAAPSPSKGSAKNNKCGEPSASKKATVDSTNHPCASSNSNKATPPAVSVPSYSAAAAMKRSISPLPEPATGISLDEIELLMNSEEALKILCADISELQNSEHSAVLSSSFRLQPRGIRNPGNLCFVNSILQCLMGTYSFCRLSSTICAAKPLLDPATSPVLCALGVIAAEFHRLRASAAEANNGAHGDDDAGDDKDKKKSAVDMVVLGGNAVNSALVMELVHRFVRSEERLSAAQIEQEDADEFLVWLLDSVHDELLKLQEIPQVKAENGANKDSAAANGKEGDEVGNGGDAADDADDDDGWLVKSGKKVVRKQEVSAAPQESETLVTSLFQGKLATSVACPGAPNSVTIHPFKALSLPISNANIVSVNDALDDFTASETLEDYKPTSDAQPQEAQKSERFQSLPEVLVLHLMRFQYTGRSAKINKFITYEPTLVMRSSWLAQGARERGATFELVATVSHHGKTMSSGHYTADVVQPDGRWLRFDDGSVYWVGQQAVMSERPYMLVYQRVKAHGAA